jgi:2-methylcitrate dehydratase PrpD
MPNTEADKLRKESKTWRTENGKNSPEIPLNGIQLPPGKVGIKSRNGETYVKRVDFPYGHHLNPMTTQALVEKFRDCVSFSPKPIPEKNVEQAIEGIMHLEEVTDVVDILRLLE